jgi:hypothetical protein
MYREILFAFALTVGIAHADLTWDKPVQEFHSVPEDKAVVAHFAFKNTGNQPVTIKKVITSCGCTTAKLSKETFAPGETGDIEVKFTFLLRRGAQRKIISVTSEDKHEWRLDLRCWIHDPLTVSPALVYWKSGTPAEPKTLKLTSSPGQPITVKSVKSSNPRIKAALTTVRDGQEYSVTVTPVDTTQEAAAELTIETEMAAAAPRSYKAFARIK